MAERLAGLGHSAWRRQADTYAPGPPAPWSDTHDPAASCAHGLRVAPASRRAPRTSSAGPAGHHPALLCAPAAQGPLVITPLYCAYQQRRAACPQGPTHCTRVPAPCVPTADARNPRRRCPHPQPNPNPSTDRNPGPSRASASRRSMTCPSRASTVSPNPSPSPSPSPSPNPT